MNKQSEIKSFLIITIVKAGLMFYVAFSVQDEPLMTMGDAVASFLENEDLTTKNMCLSTQVDFRNRTGYQVGPRQWTNERFRWKDVTSTSRKIITVVIFLLALITVMVLLKIGIDNLPSDTNFDEFALGAVDPRTSIMYMPADLISNAIIANTPQLVLSVLYFSYNGLFTAMLMGYEWISYARKRKGLRVTRQPSGAQRSTYFLSLPYRFGIPLMVISGILHWLVSQSIFLIAIDFYDAFGNPAARPPPGNIAWDYKTLGYSPSGAIAVLVLGGLLVISIITAGYIPYKRGMPLAGSCSMAISAACHPIEQVDGGENIAEKKLQWGVVNTGVDGIGHCAFSAEEVGVVVEGNTYGGHSL
ncbi:hypothetical protein J4E91_005414 [Alternaria rosae]|nr:hypothetical protein J4E91_005414 [Alternaria rosae]